MSDQPDIADDDPVRTVRAFLDLADAAGVEDEWQLAHLISTVDNAVQARLTVGEIRALLAARDGAKRAFMKMREQREADMKVIAAYYEALAPGVPFLDGFDAGLAMELHFAERVAGAKAKLDRRIPCGDVFHDGGYKYTCAREADHGLHAGDGYQWDENHARVEPDGVLS